MANSNGWGDGAANNAIGWGQGANNNIGWGKSHSLSNAGLTDIVGLTTDADAQAFITAAAITDATQISAINNLVVGMKSDGIWTKMKAIYPFVGGTASTHKWNLKDPRDLDAAFRLVFNGGWTHSSTGATPNGVNAYADTKLVPTTNITINNSHLSIYTRTNVNSDSWDMGSGNGNGNAFLLTAKFNSLSKSIGFISGIYPTNAAIYSTTSNLGFRLASRTASNIVKLFFNDILGGTNTVASSIVSAQNVYLGANNDILFPTFSPRQTAFSTIGDGLTDTEASNLYTRVQAFQTALSRQV
jgi:hypothetical protein